MKINLKKFQINCPNRISRIVLLVFFSTISGTVSSQYISESIIGLKGPVKEITETTFRVNSFTQEKAHLNTRIIHFNKNDETTYVYDSITNTTTTYMHKDGKVVSAEIKNDSVSSEKYNWIDTNTYQIIKESNEVRALVKLDSAGRIIQWDEPSGWKEEYIYDGQWLVKRIWYPVDAEKPTTINNAYANVEVDQVGNVISYETSMIGMRLHVFHTIEYYE